MTPEQEQMLREIHEEVMLMRNHRLAQAHEGEVKALWSMVTKGNHYAQKRLAELYPGLIGTKHFSLDDYPEIKPYVIEEATHDQSA